MAADDSNPSRVNFTAARVRDFTCPPGKTEAMLWDTAAPGLGLRVRNGGAKSYLFQFRIHGKAARINIGSPDAWGIDQARAEARRFKVLVDQGTDPRHEKQERAEAHAAKQAEAARQSVTLGELWPLYIEDRRADWSAAHLDDHQKALQAPGMDRQRSSRKTVAGPLYSLKDKRLVDLTAGTIEAWLRKERAKRPTVTARAFRLLRAFMNWCAEQEADKANPDTLNLKGLIPENALSRKVKRAVPAKGVKDDRLERGDLGAWFEHVGKINAPAIRAYLMTLLLTGARRTEILELRWEHVDFKRRTLTIRDKANSQGGKDGTRVIPLAPFVASMLRELDAMNQQGPTVRHLRNMEKRGEMWEPSPWVFSSLTSRNGRLQEPRIAHNRALTDAGLPHVTLHGLRRTFAIMSEAAGAPAGGVAQIMGHKPSGTVEQHYRPRNIEELREILASVEGWILEQAGIEQPAADDAGQGLKVVGRKA